MRCTLLALLLLGACSVGEVGGGGTPDGGGGAGDATFRSMISPLVTRCLGCHSTTQPPNLSSFAALQATYKTKPGSANILVTKGSLTGGTHQGIQYLDATDQAKVAAWIDSL
jgi:hypothetical protein